MKYEALKCEHMKLPYTTALACLDQCYLDQWAALLQSLQQTQVFHSPASQYPLIGDTRDSAWDLPHTKITTKMYFPQVFSIVLH